MLHSISVGKNRFGVSVMMRLRRFPSWRVGLLTIFVSVHENYTDSVQSCLLYQLEICCQAITDGDS